MNPKKVLHVITVSFVINHFFGKQFRYLESKTGNTYFLGCSPSEELITLAPSSGYIPFQVEITRSISPVKDIISIYKLYKFIKKNRIDVVIGHTPKGGMVAMLASFLAGVQDRVYFRHGIFYETSKGLKRTMLKNIDRLSGNLAKKVVCVSHGVKETSESDGLNAASKNLILGKGTCNGIDTEVRFNPHVINDGLSKELKKKYGIQEGDLVVGYVGRLVRDKGINELIDAWQILRKSRANIKLLLVGPIEERDSISELAKDLIQTDSTIINTGFVLDSAPYFLLMDVFALPTYREGFPTVALEASAMQIPVIITKATGCAEAIVENTTGLFVNHDVEDLVAKMAFYIDNVEQRLAHGLNGRAFVQQNFEQHKIWDEIHTKLDY